MKILIYFAYLLMALPGLAQPLLTFEGHVVDEAGVAIEGPVRLRFALYAEAEGGEPLWTEALPADVIAGDFVVTLGAVEPLGDVLATMDARWIGLALGEDIELQPRTRLTEVPRAAAALWAADVTGQDVHPRSVSIGRHEVINSDGEWVGPRPPDLRYRFRSLDADERAVCGVLEDGRPFCWGNLAGLPDWFEDRNPQYTSIDAAEGVACGQTADGGGGCWTYFGQAMGSPAPPYRQVVAWGESGCFLLDTGEVQCIREGEMTPLPGRYRRVCAGGPVFCGVIERGGAIDCLDGGEAPPGMAYTDVRCGGRGEDDRTVCGQRADGSVVCVGPGFDGPAGTFQQFHVGPGAVCGIGADGKARCEGRGAHAYWAGAGLTQVVAGRDRFCGLRADGTAMCWGPWGEPLLVPEKVAP